MIPESIRQQADAWQSVWAKLKSIFPNLENLPFTNGWTGEKTALEALDTIALIKSKRKRTLYFLRWQRKYIRNLERIINRLSNRAEYSAKVRQALTQENATLRSQLSEERLRESIAELLT